MSISTGDEQALLKHKHSIMEIYVAFIHVSLHDTERGLSAVSSKNSRVFSTDFVRIFSLILCLNNNKHQ